MVHHAVVERLRRFGQQRQPVAVGQQEQELADRRFERTARAISCSTTARLRAANTAGLVSTLKRLIAGDEPGEIAEVALRPQILAFSEHDVEQRRVPVAAPRLVTGLPARAVRGRSSPTRTPTELGGVTIDEPDLIFHGVIDLVTRVRAGATVRSAARSTSSRRAMRSRRSISRRVIEQALAFDGSRLRDARLFGDHVFSALRLECLELGRQRREAALDLPRGRRAVARVSAAVTSA